MRRRQMRWRREFENLSKRLRRGKRRVRCWVVEAEHCRYQRTDSQTDGEAGTTHKIPRGGALEGRNTLERRNFGRYPVSRNTLERRNMLLLHSTTVLVSRSVRAGHLR